MSTEQPAESFKRLLDEYRRAMMLRWVHESQDKAARNLAMLVSNLARKGLITVAPPAPGPTREEE